MLTRRPVPTPALAQLRPPETALWGWRIEWRGEPDATLRAAERIFASRAPWPPSRGAVEACLEVVAEAPWGGAPARPIADGQSYELRLEPSPSGGVRARLSSPSSTGAAYGLFTLAQLAEPVGNGMGLPLGRIEDRPDFDWRGITWGLWAECGVWSYDWGDGADAFRRRAVRALDLAFERKINLINVDGIGWNPERFPGYGELMRGLATEARTRGIKLLYVGYGAGYGAGPRHDGPAFRNRRIYPDGPVYPCCHIKGSAEAATFGLCLSNPALRRLKQENLRAFVRATHPGALYIHNADQSTVAEVEWAGRCPECRRQWPNDDLCAPDGMAGAMAAHYDSLAEAVSEVADSRAGYDAARDCLCVFISPGYTTYACGDAAWDLHRRYWTAVSRAMRRVDNVQFGLREQFARDDGKALRIEQMADDLRRDGQGHGIAVLAVGGADGFCNGLLFNGSPALTWMWRGARTVLHCCGNAYQEPLALLCAEYAWRSEKSAFYNEPARRGRDSVKQYIELRDGLRAPSELAGVDGFLGLAARALYGEAGPHVAAVHGAINTTGKEANPAISRNAESEEDPPTPFVDNYELLNTPRFRVDGRWLAGQWAMDIPEAGARRHSAMFARKAKVNRWAEARMRDAVAACLHEGDAKEALEWQRLGLEFCGGLAQLLSDYFAIYADAQGGAGGSMERLKDLRDRLAAFAARVAASPLGKAQPLTLLGGAASNWTPTLQMLQTEARLFHEALASGSRGKPRRGTWW